MNLFVLIILPDLVREDPQGSESSHFADLNQVVVGLAVDVESAKAFASSQIDLLREIYDQEIDELHSQVSVLQNELDNLKHYSSNLSDELANERKDKRMARQEAKSMSIQLNKLEKALEHYFLLSRKQSSLLHLSAKLQERSVLLLASINGKSVYG